MLMRLLHVSPIWMLYLFFVVLPDVHLRDVLFVSHVCMYRVVSMQVLSNVSILVKTHM